MGAPVYSPPLAAVATSILGAASAGNEDALPQHQSLACARMATMLLQHTGSCMLTALHAPIMPGHSRCMGSCHAAAAPHLNSFTFTKAPGMLLCSSDVQGRFCASGAGAARTFTPASMPMQHASQFLFTA